MKSEPQKIIEDGIAGGLTKAVKPLIHWAVIGAVLFTLVGLFLKESGVGRDSTDGVKRSNMALRIDYGTGCQYLETSGGGIIKRTNKQGQHMGCNK